MDSTATFFAGLVLMGIGLLVVGIMSRKGVFTLLAAMPFIYTAILVHETFYTIGIVVLCAALAWLSLKGE